MDLPLPLTLVYPLGGIINGSSFQCLCFRNTLLLSPPNCRMGQEDRTARERETIAALTDATSISTHATSPLDIASEHLFQRSPCKGFGSPSVYLPQILLVWTSKAFALHSHRLPNLSIQPAFLSKVYTPFILLL